MPSLGKNRNSGAYIIPKRYKSKKVELALKSDSSDIIKQIRDSIKEESLTKVMKDHLSWRNYRQKDQ